MSSVTFPYPYPELMQVLKESNTFTRNIGNFCKTVAQYPEYWCTFVNSRRARYSLGLTWRVHYALPGTWYVISRHTYRTPNNSTCNNSAGYFMLLSFL